VSDEVRILHLEDDPGDAELVARALRAAGLAGGLVQVASQQAFLAALDGQSFDAVISDFALPGFDGLRALALVHERRLDLPFILVSGTIGEEKAIEVIRQGVTDFVLKDRLTRLDSVLRRALEETAERRRRRQAEVALERERRLLKAVLDSVDAAIVACDAEGVGLTLVNRSAREWNRLAEGPLDPQWVDQYEVLSADGQVMRPDETPLLRALRGEVVRGLEVSLAGRSETRRVVASGQPILDAEGGRLGAVLAMHDVSDMKRAEEELRRQREALYQSEKLAAMGTLLASVAHELNNPLAVVLGQANLLRRDAGGGPLAVRADKIEKAAERCARIVANFLALARQRPPERKRVALRPLVEAALELLAYSLQLDGVEVRLELADDAPRVEADGHQLQQVLINLFTNAHHSLRETPPPRRLTVRTRFDSDRRRMVLEVADSGRGVPVELRQRIFDPFFTTKPPDRGTGLGLPLCQEIVQAHGGTMGVGEAEGGGAQFWIELPVGEGAPAPLERAADPVPEVVAAGRSILVVDDEPEVAEVVAESLRGQGHHVDVALGGMAGLALIARGHYDLILSDVKMPDLDGKALFREVRGLDPALARHFVFTTGDGLSSETQGFFEKTGVPILRKPFDLSEVQKVVGQVLADANPQ
jgi:signal transduction histidine kinase